jgi:hypothetical protein
MFRSNAAKLVVVCACVAAIAVMSLQQIGIFENQDVARQLLGNGVTAGDPLRIAVFGSSQSWGAILEDRFMAYPYRLSPRVDNFAYFAAGKSRHGGSASR